MLDDIDKLLGDDEPTGGGGADLMHLWLSSSTMMPQFGAHFVSLSTKNLESTCTAVAPQGSI